MTDVVSRLSRELGQPQLEPDLGQAGGLIAGSWKKPHTSAMSIR
jgi:hypothetical protein